jgi:hypothetical protein
MLRLSIDATATLIGLATALGAGLLIGVERERTKGSGMGRGAAGVRTFTLLALTGSIAALLGSVATAVAGVFVALAMFASYRLTQVDDPGLTTEVAMLVTYFLGLLAMRSPALAGGLGVVVALILASKAHLHRFTRERLSQQDATEPEGPARPHLHCPAGQQPFRGGTLPGGGGIRDGSVEPAAG